MKRSPLGHSQTLVPCQLHSSKWKGLNKTRMSIPLNRQADVNVLSRTCMKRWEGKHVCMYGSRFPELWMVPNWAWYWIMFRVIKALSVGITEGFVTSGLWDIDEGSVVVWVLWTSNTWLNYYSLSMNSNSKYYNINSNGRLLLSKNICRSEKWGKRNKMEYIHLWSLIKLRHYCFRSVLFSWQSFGH